MVQSKTEKLRILFLITKSNWGGAQRYVYDLATNLDPETFSITVAAGGTGEQNAPPGKLASMVQKAGISFIHLRHLTRAVSAWSEIQSAREIWHCLHQQRPDVVHLNSSKAALLGAVLARLCRIPTVIFTVHGFPYVDHQPRIVQWLAKLATALTFLCATDIICICNADVEIAKTYRTARRKIHTIPNGIELNVSLPNKRAARNKLRSNQPTLRYVDNTIPWIATGTELRPRKGIHTVIDACASLITQGYDFHLCVCGTGPYEKNLRDQVEHLGISQQVTFLGFVDDLPQIATAFDGFVLASYKEGLPYILLEIARAEVPLIASNIDGIPDIITHKKTGQLIDPNNTQTVAEALAALLEKPQHYQVQATRLAEKMQANFSLTTMVQATQNVYRN